MLFMIITPNSRDWYYSKYLVLIVLLKFINASNYEPRELFSINSICEKNQICIPGSSREVNNEIGIYFSSLKRKGNFQEDIEPLSKKVKLNLDPSGSSGHKTPCLSFTSYKHILNDATLYKDCKFREDENNNLYFKLAVLSDDILRSDLNLAFSYDEMQAYYNKNIKNIAIPSKILKFIKADVFLFYGNDVIKTGIIKSETRDILNIEFVNKPILKKILKAIKVIGVCQRTEKICKTASIRNKIHHGEMDNEKKDDLTNEPIKNHDKIYGIKVSKFKLTYEDIQLLNVEIKNDLNAKNILRNFKYEINMNSERYNVIEEWMDETGITIPDIFIDPITYSQLNQTPIYDNKSLNRFINRSTIAKISQKHTKTKGLEGEIEIIYKENLSLVRNWRKAFNSPQFPTFFDFIERKVLVLDCSSGIDFDPNENNSNKLFLAKKYIYLYSYHQHLKKFIDRLDNKKIFEFFLFCKNTRKKKRTQKILEFKIKSDEEKLREVYSYLKSKNNIESDVKFQKIVNKKRNVEEKYKTIFPDFESELVYEIEKFPQLEEVLIDKMKILYHSTEIFNKDFANFWNDPINIAESDINCEKRILYYLYKYENSFDDETDSIDQIKCVLKLDYELRRVFNLKKRNELNERYFTRKINLSEKMIAKLKNFNLYVDEQKKSKYKEEISLQLLKLFRLRITFERIFQKIKETPEMKYGLYMDEISELEKNFKCKKKIEMEFITDLRNKFSVNKIILENYDHYVSHINIHTKKLEYQNPFEMIKNIEFLNELRQNFKKNVGDLKFIIDINTCNYDRKNNNLIIND